MNPWLTPFLVVTGVLAVVAVIFGLVAPAVDQASLTACQAAGGEYVVIQRNVLCFDAEGHHVRM